MHTDLKPYFDLVDAAISELGLDPGATQGNGPGSWILQRGTAKVWVDIWFVERHQQAYFQVLSPIMQLPVAAKQQAFFRELLELNDTMCGVAFTLHNEWAWLRHLREVIGLDKSEVLATLQRVGTYADRYDDHLLGKYGTEGASDQENMAPAPPGKA